MDKKQIVKDYMSELGKKGVEGKRKKYGDDYWKKISAKQFDGMSKEQISEHMRKVREGKSPKV